MKPANVSGFLWLQYQLLFLTEHFWGYRGSRKILGGMEKKMIAQLQKINPAQQRTQTIHSNIPYEDAAYSPEPLVFRGAARNWSATQNWSLAYFVKRFGERTVNIDDIKGNTQQQVSSEEMKLADYLEEVKAGSLKYLKFSDLVQKEKSLQEDLDTSWMKRFVPKGAFGATFYLFIGGKGSVTPLHNEFPCNIYLQLHGTKKWVLYPPEDRIFLDPRTERRPYFFSNVNPDHPDDSNFTLAKNARKMEVVLQPGDALWVPPFYWHHIVNESESIGVAYKFAQFPAALRSSRMLSLLFCLSTRPSILYTFIANRITKEDTIVKKNLNAE